MITLNGDPGEWFDAHLSTASLLSRSLTCRGGDHGEWLTHIPPPPRSFYLRLSHTDSLTSVCVSLLTSHPCGLIAGILDAEGWAT